MDSISCFWALSQKLFDLEGTYWTSFCAARYFSWNMNSQKAQCICRACGVPSGKQWHKRVFVLPCGSYIISRLQFQGWLLKGSVVPDPCGTLAPPLNPSDFYLSQRGRCWLHHNLILVQFHCLSLSFVSLSSLAALDQELKGALARLAGRSTPGNDLGAAARQCGLPCLPAWPQLFQPLLIPTN